VGDDGLQRDGRVDTGGGQPSQRSLVRSHPEDGDDIRLDNPGDCLSC
jgi:hypothetical protein